MLNTKVKVSTQADESVLEAMREIANQEGRQFQAVLDEAMRDYIEKKRTGKSRPYVLAALNKSLGEFDALYRELAK